MVAEKHSDPFLCRRLIRLGALAFLLVLAQACSEIARESPLAHARRSPEALARAALDALKDGDTAALDSLRVTREEYENLLWPVLPDRNHVPFEFVWSVTGPRSRKALREVMGEYEGISLEFVKLELGKDIESYDEFTIFKEARMTVRRADTGVEGMIPLMDALVVMGGGWKFLNFGEDL
jgi:hypothetical protein